MTPKNIDSSMKHDITNLIKSGVPFANISIFLCQISYNIYVDEKTIYFFRLDQIK